jgi:hypoxanthine phosphoribosyltransferase
MLHYRNFADLAWTVSAGMARIPRDVDLVVGIPRSGLFAAWYIGLSRNLSIIDLPTFVKGGETAIGRTRLSAHAGVDSPRRILLVDDSALYGKTMRQAVEQVRTARPEAEVTTLAVYADEPRHKDVDIVLDAVPFPRIFEWNMAHSWIVEASCYDLDGVLCRDPTPAESEDDAAYARFLREAEPLLIPTGRIRRIVTSRLEQDRAATEDWLARHGIDYGELVMLDLPSRASRRQFGIHGEFKSMIYRDDREALLFVESEPAQAKLIAKTSRKVAFDYEGRRMIQPQNADEIYAQTRSTRAPRSLRRRLSRRVASFFKGLSF